MTIPRRIIVMGVSGCGKSVVGRAVAEKLGFRFVDADDHHSPENIAKMSNGIALTDADRADWLNTLAEMLAQNDGIVLACSALKASYRRRLSSIDPPMPVFVHLHGSFAAILDRLESREGHYFGGRSMLETQFETLEPPAPDEAINVQVDDADKEEVVDRCLSALQRRQPTG